jgi:hypothetical protein
MVGGDAVALTVPDIRHFGFPSCRIGPSPQRLLLLMCMLRIGRSVLVQVRSPFSRREPAFASAKLDEERKNHEF